MRDSVVIYRSLYEALKGVNERSYKKVMQAILGYAMDGKEPNLTGLEMTVFLIAKPQIDANNIKYENGKKGAQSGAKGGRPKRDIESYDDIFVECAVEPSVKAALIEFIKHCQLNGKMVTNDKLYGIIVELDMQTTDKFEKVKIIKDAINGGYFDIKRR